MFLFRNVVKYINDFSCNIMRELAFLLAVLGSIEAFDPYVEGPHPVRHE
jgi:hypothetical protein